MRNLGLIEAYPIVPNKVGRSVSTTLYALSDNTKYSVYDMDGFGSIIQYYALGESKTYGKNVALLPFDKDVLNAYPADKFDVIYMDLNIKPIDISDGSWPVVTTLNKALDAGKKVFVSGYQAAWYTYDPDADAAFKTEAAKSFFKDFLGVEYVRNQDRNDGQRYIPFTIQGLDNNDICRGISFEANIIADYCIPYTDIIRPLQGSKSESIMQYDNNISNVAAVRCDKGNGKKALYFTTSMKVFSNESDWYQIMDKGTEWLLAESSNDVKEDAAIVTSASVSPNPAVGSAYMQFTATKDGNATISIVNALGVKVADLGSPAVKEGSNTIALPTDNLTSGTYTVVVVSGGSTQNIPFVVTR